MLKKKKERTSPAFVDVGVRAALPVCHQAGGPTARMLVPPSPSPVCLTLLRAVVQGWKQGQRSRQAMSWCSVPALSA